MTKIFVKISYYILGMVIVIAGMLASVSEAGVKFSKHDFSVNGANANFAGQYVIDDGINLPITEVCIFCHTPHGASSDAQTSSFLWNRINPVGPQTYTPYTASTSTTVGPDASNGGKPTGISLMCMSCHDGVTSIAVGTLVNMSGPGNPPMMIDPWGGTIASPGAIGNVLSGGLGGWGANIGNAIPGDTTINMSNDHPISFEWNLSVPGYTYPPTRPELRLFGASGMRIECATCHSVHDDTNFPFLSMPNTNSDMCRACHDK